MNNALADQLQVWGFEKDLIVFNDGSMGFGVDCVPLDISTADDAAINSVAVRNINFLNSLPEGIDIQFYQEISRGNEALIKAHAGLAQVNDGLVVDLNRYRMERLTSLDESGAVPVHKLRLFVRRPLSVSLVSKSKIFAQTTKFPKLSEERFRQEVEAVERVQKQVTDLLSSVGLSVAPLTSQQLLDLIYEQWNPERRIDRGRFDPEDIREGLIFSDAQLYEDGFSLGAMHHKVISLKLLPETTVSGMAEKLRALPFNSKLCLTIHVPNQQKELSNLQLQRRMAFSLAHGNQSGVRDVEGQAKFHDLEELIENIVAAGEKVFHVGLNVILRSRSKTELESQVAETLLVFRQLASAEGMVEGYAAFDIFTSLAIPNARVSERQKRMKTSNLADLLPIFGPWRGHPTPSLILRSRSGSLLSFDPFASELPNSNQIVSGGSGSGKSFMTNILLLQMLKERPRIFIVDIGGSYRKLCENLGGQYIPFVAGRGLCLNPFDNGTQDLKVSSQKIKFISTLIELMTKEDGEARIPKYERAICEELIGKVFESDLEPGLSVLQRLMSEHKESSIARLGKVLAPWCGQSHYGQFFDGPTTVTLEKPIVCFDLKGLEDYPDLQAVCLLIITAFVWEQVQLDRESRKFLILDECWKLTESEAGSAFVGEVFRTFRKYSASAIAISQNIDDFARSRVASAILPNSAIKWVLMQKGVDQARLQEVLQLNDNELRLIGSLRQERGEYSEAFLVAGDRRSVVSIESTPLEYWIATTDPNDLAVVDQMVRDSGKSNIEILRELSQRYPQGVAKARKEFA